MGKTSKIVPPSTVNPIVKCLTDLVTGNPIVKENTPIKKDRQGSSRTLQVSKQSKQTSSSSQKRAS